MNGGLVSSPRGRPPGRAHHTIRCHDPVFLDRAAIDNRQWLPGRLRAVPKVATVANMTSAVGITYECAVSRQKVLRILIE